MSIDGMHKDEQYWGDDAHEYNPERFMQELKNRHAPFAGKLNDIIFCETT